MSRHFFVVATGPLLEQGATVMSGQCLRTWHFCAPLLRAGHRVTLITIPIPGATADDGAAKEEAASYQGFPYIRLSFNAPHLALPRLEALLAERGPFDAAVGINAYPAWLLARLAPNLPFWADLNGWTMAEGVTRAAVVGHDNDFAHFWKLEVATLLAADRFSTVTERQAYALEGELALLGRLNAKTFAESFASSVPNAIYPDYATLERRSSVPEFLRDRLPADARIVLWTGGFNTWTDTEMLTEGMARLLAADPSAAFVCTGGAVLGHDELTYKRFLEVATKRLPAGRFLPLGWVPLDQVVALHAAAAVGINIDGTNVETRFGARNRLTNMLGCGLPVLTTRGTEIAAWIEAHGAGTVIPPGSAAALADALAGVLRDREATEAMAAQARTAALEAFAPEATLREFLQWAGAPCRAADRSAPIEDGPIDRLRRWLVAQSASETPFAPEPPFTSPSLPRRVLRKIRWILRS